MEQECQKLSTERAENEEKLEVLYERWEELAILNRLINVRFYFVLIP